MKNLVISGWVIVTGPPLFICSLNFGTTEPDEFKTFPKRTIEKFTGRIYSLTFACNIISDNLLLAPMIFGGLTALSVLTRTNFERRIG